jgi:hypothetical protein
MMHASAEQTQAALAAQRVVASQSDHRIRTNEMTNQ